MTPEERAKELVKQDGGGDYYYEGWAQEDSIASAIRAAEDEALERAARHIAKPHEQVDPECGCVTCETLRRAAHRIRSLKSKGTP